MKLKLLKTETLNGKRATNLGGYKKTGFPEDPTYVAFTFDGNAQPITGKELLQVPEGERYKDPYNVWTDYQLQPKDIVERKGVFYEVKAVEDWFQQDLQHYKARMTRQDV